MKKEKVSWLSYIGKREAKYIILEFILVLSTVSLFYLFTAYNSLVYGILFSIIAAINLVYRIVICFHIKRYFTKHVWLLNDFISVVLPSFIFGILQLIDGHFIINFNRYLVFDILFIIYVLLLVLFDFLIKGLDE